MSQLLALKYEPVQARELRTGTILYYFIAEEGLGWQPTLLDLKDIKLCEENPNYFNAMHARIPLDDFWARQCGFKHLGKGMYVNGNLRLTLTDGVFWFVNYDSSRLLISTVDRLQSLYFGLTGSDLPITLEEKSEGYSVDHSPLLHPKVLT